MRGQNGYDLWIIIFLIVVLLQDSLLVIVNTKDATTKKQTTSSREGQKKELPDLENSETSYYNMIIQNPSNSYHPFVYNPKSTFTYFPSSSGFSNSIFSFASGQNTSDDVHQQIKCGDTFPQVCQHSRYRSYDGSCNNLQNPTWGLANTRYGRLVRPRYGDGIRTPSKSIFGEDLPLARAVSYMIFPNCDVNDIIWTLLAMQYGQIIAHDMGLIDGTTQTKPHDTQCCTFDGQIAWDKMTLPQCFPILIPKNDPVYSKFSIQCLNFVRSTTDLDRDCSSPYPAEQLNVVTHYLDLSLVYGLNNKIAASLRTGFGGRLKVEFKNDREFPPSISNKTTICDTVYEFEPCYATGDTRANQNPQLTIIQIILLREHNRIANYLTRLNPHWTDETIFQETRRIVIAEHQNIAYYEWLPIFLGAEQVYDKKIIYNTQGYVNDYDETVKGIVLNEHSNAAFRYFHSNIAGFINLVSKDRFPVKVIRLSDHFNRPGIIEENNNLDDLTRGFTYQPQKRTDVCFDKEITQHLFKEELPRSILGSDLRAIDIQRDRDHGLASYNDYREYCGLPRAKTFTDFADYILLSDILKLIKLYRVPDDVELTVGGSLERHVNGSLAGPTFLCIMTRQFQQTRIGDRYWFETGDPKIAFTIEQLNELRKSSISRLLCDNGDNIQYMQKSGFVQISLLNPLRKCDELPQVDLSFWKDYGPENHGYTTPLYKKR